jgi:guanylate kinase
LGQLVKNPVLCCPFLQQTILQGKLIIITAPSGSGKTTIARYLLSQLSTLEFSISATTREQRPNEEHGKDYYYNSVEEFKNRLANNEFVEHEEVYPGIFYGTLKSEIERIWQKGNHVVFDVDVVGSKNLKEMYGDKALLLFIRLPDFETLENRLRARSTENDEQLNVRLNKARLEMEYEQYADVTVLNDNLETAQQHALQVVSEFINQ